jgi:hypothetical protein
MEQTVEHIRINLNKELWKIDYSIGVAKHIRENITVGNNDKGNSAERQNNNNKDNNREGLMGYNGDITQYLEEKGYTWEQLDEDSIKFKHDNEFRNR